MAQVDKAFIGFLGHRPVDAGEATLIDFGRELAGLLDLGDGTKLQRGQLARPLANAVGEIVADDDQILAQVVLAPDDDVHMGRSEEHTSELQSLMRISYAVFCLKKKK